LKRKNKIYLSLFGGVLLPSLYVAFLMLLGKIIPLVSATICKEGILRRAGESLFDLILLPVFFPSSIYFYFYPSGRDFPAFAIFDLGNILSLLIGNFLFYSAFSFVVITILSKKPTEFS
jgi:hypothetical protein